MMPHCEKPLQAPEWDPDAKEEEANRKRSEATRGVAWVPKGETRKEGVVSRDTRPSPDTWQHTHIAQAAQVSTATAARAQALSNKRPDLLEKVAAGKSTPEQIEAARVIKPTAPKPRSRAITDRPGPYPWGADNCLCLRVLHCHDPALPHALFFLKNN